MQSAFFKFVFSLWSSFKNYWQSPSNIRGAKCWNAFSFSGPKFSYQFWLATTWTTCESIKLRCNRMKDEVLWLRIFPANPCLRNIMYCIVATPGAIQCFLANEDATLCIGGKFRSLSFSIYVWYHTKYLRWATFMLKQYEWQRSRSKSIKSHALAQHPDKINRIWNL